MCIDNIKLKSKRLEKCLTQECLAFAIGSSTSVIQKIELGETKSPTICLVKKICDCLGIEIKEVLK